MRVLVTGSTGFAGGWLIAALEEAGHTPVRAPAHADLDIADAASVRKLVDDTAPDAIAHLAAMAFAPDAAAKAADAMRTNMAGTLAVVEAALAQRRRPVVLVAGSSAVYASLDPPEALTEDAPLAARGPYALSKLGAEAVAVHAATRGLSVAVTRAFNHTGPGQRTDFAVPAFAQGILKAKSAGGRTIRVGDVDVRRDIGDVRDTVRAYVKLLEALADGDVRHSPPVYNVATGVPTHLRTIIGMLSRLIEWDVELEVDPDLTRDAVPLSIHGSSERLTTLTGWQPRIPLGDTLADVIRYLR